ncbi:Alpha/Beta hydrolase protein [Sparassis latifolia]|uniref:AB hydrolase superfamily protein n=1 Tax=Sparassis crispa TaxID=139825 RepID=A0A401GKP6_9APHY|nr:AB hydrolase superfamily protein [Sparassis crispa]GBE82736.1 AB hydrolase superfamily protein [Sparassis crispa]
MSQYSYLSTPDPEFADVLAKLPPQPALSESGDISLIRAGFKEAVGEHDKHLQSRLPLASAYTMKDHKIPVEGGEIVARCVVPAPSADKSFPVLVWFHGGGWTLGDVHTDDYRLRMLCVALQISIVNVDYRLAPEHVYPTAWDDSYAATKWVVEHTSLLSAALNKGFIVAGCSAGTNLAAHIANRARDDPFFAKTPITGQYLQVPCLLDPEADAGKYKSELLSMEQNKDAPSLTRADIVYFAHQLKIPPSDLGLSLLLQPSHAGLPPLYAQIAGLDPLRDEGLLYAKVLGEAGVKTKVDVYPGVPHGFNFFYSQLRLSAKLESDVDAGVGWLLSLVA